MSKNNAAIQNGKVEAYGFFQDPFLKPNFLEAKIPMIPAWVRRFRLKEWQHFAVITPDFFMGFVVSTSHYFAMSFCYIVDLETGKIIAHEQKAEPWAAKIPKNAWNSDGFFKKNGFSIALHNRLDRGFYHAKIRIQGNQKRLQRKITANLRFIPKSKPLVALLPISKDRPLYTHKVPMSVFGDIQVGNRLFSLHSSTSFALLDIHKTFFPYKTQWKWATFAGYDEKGDFLALNLVDNMIRGDENENCLWLNDRIILLGKATFDYNPNCLTDPWHIVTNDGRCDITLVPMTVRVGKTDLKVIKTDYKAPIGRFSGSIIAPNGETHNFSDIVGIAEEHKARF